MGFGLDAGSGGGSATLRQLRPTGHYTTVTPLTINGAGRQPSTTTPMQIIASINLDVDDNEAELVEVQISSDNGVGDPYQTIARAQHDFQVGGLLGVTGDSNIEMPVTFEIPTSWYYRFISTGSGSSTNSLLKERAI